LVVAIEITFMTTFSRREALIIGGSAAVGISMAAAADPHVPLPFDKYSRLDALGLAELVKRGEVTPGELLEAAIARADAVHSKINAVVVPLYDQARQAVATGVPRGPFQGVPFLVKNLGFWMQGVPADEGSKLFCGQVPAQDDTLIERYRRAGLVIVGRTNAPEFGLVPVTESAVHGTTRNPWNLERTAGGSSGGSAAAVAARITPMASGDDGGGSIRIPASCCGLFGLKPTRARVPYGPIAFELWQGLAAPHAITRSVRDSAALLDATQGPDLGDAYWAPPPQRPFLAEVGVPPGRLRVALAYRVLPNIPLHEECRHATAMTGKLMESLGHMVDDVTDRFAELLQVERLYDVYRTLLPAETALVVRDRLQQLSRPLQEDDLEPITRRFVEMADSVSAADVLVARRTIFEGARMMARFQQNYDVILTPTLSMPPIEHGQLSLSNKSRNVYREVFDFCPFTPLANITGQPAMSLPLHWTSDMLPVGVQILGRFGDEATLYRLASQLEQARPWTDRRAMI
jgi:Asp-tRNA(Asn)/Glu-tRNA(Gln) amidotransferase A subunit family amidase